MKSTTDTEENYLKAVFKHSTVQEPSVSTNTLAHELGTTPASVTDMVKKLSEKGLLEYAPYRGVSLTDRGRQVALYVIRKHRLWEVFLVEKLHFSWDEVHETAEQLEHIDSELLVARLDEFLGFPRFDPHGDPIPNKEGKMEERNAIPLANAPLETTLRMVGVQHDTTEFLRYLSRLRFKIGQAIRIIEQINFDSSLVVQTEDADSGGIREVILSSAVTHMILVTHD